MPDRDATMHDISVLVSAGRHFKPASVSFENDDMSV